MANAAILAINLVKEGVDGGYLVVPIECYGPRSIPARGGANESRDGRQGSTSATVVGIYFRESEAQYLVRE